MWVENRRTVEGQFPEAVTIVELLQTCGHVHTQDLVSF